ncbi:MAG: helix-hairpin-helix domain-containing protein, partial [Campylobacterales bacterium]|nr:helix-hairpin-helix domain-containing protein [Campylobacterales bacterium]
ANAEELAALKGIGEKKATAIITYREANGGFKTIEELANVKGIGEKTVESLKESIEVK